MRRSKLEVYIDILKVLALKGPLKLTHVMYKSNINCRVLKEQLEFLIKNEMVQERKLAKNRAVYAITPKGMQILKTFREINQIFLEEERTQTPFLY
jgi:predicted transcriptional regulator